MKGYLNTQKKNYKVVLVDGTVFVKELRQDSVKNYIKETPGIRTISAMDKTNKVHCTRTRF